MSTLQDQLINAIELEGVPVVIVDSIDKADGKRRKTIQLLTKATALVIDDSGPDHLRMATHNRDIAININMSISGAVSVVLRLNQPTNAQTAYEYFNNNHVE